MSLHKISRTLISNFRIISFSKVAQFKFSQQQHAPFHNTPQRYSSDRFLSQRSDSYRGAGSYCGAFSTVQPTHLQKVQDRTFKEFDESETEMIGSALQGSLLTFLCKAMNAKKVLEIGCFTGYSALCFAEGIKENGPNTKVITCERDQKYANFALQNVKEAGMDELIEIKVGNALDTLREFDKSTVFDLIYIDADKPGYVNYYETILERNLLAEKGLILADNVLFSGYVQRVPNYDPNAPESSENYIPKEVYKRIAKPLYQFNEHVSKDPRTTQLMVPVFDGLTFIRKN